MAKIETLFTTKTGENPYPLGPQILYSPYKGSNLPLEDSKQWLLVDTPEFSEIIRNLVNKHQNTQNVMRPAQSLFRAWRAQPQTTYNNQTVQTCDAVGIFHLCVMHTRKSDKHTLGLNEDTQLEINHKNERTRRFVHSSLISIKCALLLS